MHKVNVDVGIRVKNADGSEAHFPLGSEVDLKDGAEVELAVGRHYPEKAISDIPKKSVGDAVKAGWLVAEADPRFVTPHLPEPPAPAVKE